MNLRTGTLARVDGADASRDGYILSVVIAGIRDPGRRFASPHQLSSARGLVLCQWVLEEGDAVWSPGATSDGGW